MKWQQQSRLRRVLLNLYSLPLFPPAFAVKLDNLKQISMMSVVMTLQQNNTTTI